MNISRNNDEVKENAREEVAKIISDAIDAIENEFVAVEADDERTREIKHLSASICTEAKDFLENSYIYEESDVYLHILHSADACECDTYSAILSCDQIEIDALRWSEIQIEDLGNAEYVRELAAHVVDQYDGIMDPIFPEDGDGNGDEDEGPEEHEQHEVYEGYEDELVP